MKLVELRLHDYRNYADATVAFSDGIHMIVGNNAQGKTNLLEAIFYLSTTRSHRTNDDQDLVREEAEAFFIKAMIEKKKQREEIRIAVNEKGKNLFIYRNPIHRVSDFIGEFNAVMFCPYDMNLFQASPRVRRRFIDMELSKISRKYVNTLYLAQKLLKERNACLKQPEVDQTYLQVITTQLLEVQLIIMKQRHHFLQALLEAGKKFYVELSQDATQLSVRYESCIPFSEDEEEMRKKLRLRYEKSMGRDMLLKQTTVGIHKEDFVFQLNGKDIEGYASQGQKRSVLLALKMGMVHMIYAITSEYPVLLLDDVFSELDKERRKKLLLSLPEEVQIFISTTDRTEAEAIQHIRRLTVWKVENGQIVQG